MHAHTQADTIRRMTQRAREDAAASAEQLRFAQLRVGELSTELQASQSASQQLRADLDTLQGNASSVRCVCAGVRCRVVHMRPRACQPHASLAFVFS